MSLGSESAGWRWPKAIGGDPQLPPWAPCPWSRPWSLSPQGGSNACPARGAAAPLVSPEPSAPWKEPVHSTQWLPHPLLLPFPNHTHTTQLGPNLSLLPVKSMAGSLVISAGPELPL